MEDWTPAMQVQWLANLGPQPVYDEFGNQVGQTPGILTYREIVELLSSEGEAAT